jgi:hypothetical protein
MGQDPDPQSWEDTNNIGHLGRMGNYTFTTTPFVLMRDDIEAIAGIVADLIERVADLEKAAAAAAGPPP